MSGGNFLLIIAFAFRQFDVPKNFMDFDSTYDFVSGTKSI